MSTMKKTLILALMLGLITSLPALAEEQMTMEQIVAMCEKQAEDQDGDPDDYIEKCIDEKGSEAVASEKAD